MSVNNNRVIGTGLDDIQVNIRFNKGDYQKLLNKYKEDVMRTNYDGKIPSIQGWIRETLLA